MRTETPSARGSCLRGKLHRRERPGRQGSRRLLVGKIEFELVSHRVAQKNLISRVGHVLLVEANAQAHEPLAELGGTGNGERNMVEARFARFVPVPAFRITHDDVNDGVVAVVEPSSGVRKVGTK